VTAPAEVPQSALEGLHEILLPDPVSWMPQTAGWYAVFGLALLVSAWWVYRRLRRFRRNLYRRLALHELAAIERDLQKPDERAGVLAGIPVLLKATALSAFPRNEVARLSGEAWLSFLDKTLGGKEFTEGEGQLLAELAYAPASGIAGLSEERIDRLLHLSRRWIKGHVGSTRAT